MTTTIPRLAPACAAPRAPQDFVPQPESDGSADVVRSLGHMLQQDELQSTGFSPTLKRVLVQMQYQSVHSRHRHGVLQVCFLSPVSQLLVVRGPD